MRSFYVLAFLALSLSGCLKLPGAIDAAPAPSDTRDPTVVFRGCGQRPQQGYLFCKVPEGANAKATTIHLIFPTETCPDTQQSCADYQFLRRDGSVGVRGSVNRKSSEAVISLDQIVDNGNISRREDGEYQVAIQLHWVQQHVIDQSGKDIGPIERTSRADGLVRVFVVKPEARPLTCNDPSKGWDADVSKSCHAEFSTTLRSALCGSGC